ncbi:helix-turn-helix domain-containing protein [Halopiger aswanensis]|uniref:Putative DNA binding protein n=1 Tax=Halopiger aswanensis TaxID=148449 RepID=A0A3R7D9U5_9EURY|nr:helix-turn-helix domain-containing protein [Halopiger aswanensis]RKD95045.1 putative DNA binding protein [Halopiger aswanensis]
MTTVVELDVPADRLGLARAFDRVPTFECQIGGMIGDGPPLVRVSGPDRRTVAHALEADPSVEVIATVTGDSGTEASVETGTNTGDGTNTDADDDGGTDRNRWLFRLEFGERLKLFEEIVSENDGAILSANGRDGRWALQLLYHDREAVSTAHRLLEQYEYRVEVTRVSGTEDLARVRTPLTEIQYETIAKAHELGYFDVPRQVTLEELAAELGISHQALSERLRRSHAALISAELSDHLTPLAIDP